MTGLRTVGTLLGLALAVSAARAEQMRLASPTSAEIQRGVGQGVAVTSTGRLFLAPRIAPAGKPLEAGAPSQVFAVALGEDQSLYFGTGPDGFVVKMPHEGEPVVLFRADEPLITALLSVPGGDLLAATAPGGRIYRIHPDGKSAVWCETHERYVWSMLPDNDDGSLYAATGDRGRVLRIDRNGHSASFFDSDEPHIVSLARAADGGLWAGGSARGLVYHIGATGRGTVLYDDDLPEAKAILPLSTGELVVAFDAAPATEKRPPALRLRLAGSAASGRDAMGDLDARQVPAMQGVIEGLAPGETDETSPVRGRIVRIAPSGAGAELWRSREEAPFALALDADRRVLFATGEPAKIWRIESPGEVALLAALREGQATTLTPAPTQAIIAATSNPAAVYHLDAEPAKSGTFMAKPEDAGSVARWGTIQWRGAELAAGVGLETRTGNCEQPDATWSAWSPVLATGAHTAAVASPEGRYLQWRATLAIQKDASPAMSAVSVSYATRNRAPTIRDLRIDPPSGALSAKTTVRWSAADPDGDGVTVDIQARRLGEDDWKSAVRSDVTAPKTDPALGNDSSSKDGRAMWDSAGWDEGVYEVRAVVSDQASNAPGEGLSATAALPILVDVDRTPPIIEAKRKGGEILVEVNDALSGVAKLEVVVDDRVAFAPRCEDGVCDGRHETFRFAASQLPAGGSGTLRATDAAGNPVEVPVPTP